MACGSWEEVPCLSIEENIVVTQAGFESIMFQGLWMFDKLEIHQEGSQPALHGGWR